jgi:hypothetical protein
MNKKKRTVTGVAKHGLPELAKQIKQEVKLGERQALEHFHKAGQLLTQAKKKFTKHGEWGKWLAANFDFSHSTTNRWMQFAKKVSASEISNSANGGKSKGFRAYLGPVTVTRNKVALGKVQVTRTEHKVPVMPEKTAPALQPDAAQLKAEYIAAEAYALKAVIPGALRQPSALQPSLTRPAPTKSGRSNLGRNHAFARRAGRPYRH